jgi:hypothetical protein
VLGFEVLVEAAINVVIFWGIPLCGACVKELYSGIFHLSSIEAGCSRF